MLCLNNNFIIKLEAHRLSFIYKVYLQMFPHTGLRFCSFVSSGESFEVYHSPLGPSPLIYCSGSRTEERGTSLV